MSMRIDQLKTKIADRAAISDIECFCERRYTSAGFWYDMASADRYTAAWVAQAAEYLKRRGLLEQAGSEVLIIANRKEVA